MATINDKVYKVIGKTIFNYGLINEGDKIIVGVSGGKDSFVLLHDLCRRMRKSPVKFTIKAVHVISDLAAIHHESELESLFKELEIPYEIIFVNIKKRIKEGRSFNCYWCAMQRRLEIFKLAYQWGYNKVAFAHHLDDVIETALLNMTTKGELSTMLPLMKYDKYPLSIIRPMYDVEESAVESLSKRLGFCDFSQICELKDTTRRKTIKELIGALSLHDKNIRKNIMRSLSHINHEYLPSDKGIVEDEQ